MSIKKAPTFSEAVGMYELSRIKPRQHLIDSLAEMTLEAARIGALVMDNNLDYKEMEEAWAHGHADGFHGALRCIVRSGVGIEDCDRRREATR